MTTSKLRFGRIFRAGAMFLATLPACGSCNSRYTGKATWNCGESIPGCSCVGKFEPAPDFTEQLCAKQYECCVEEFDAVDSQSVATCKCWNPSQGGPTCESRLPSQPTPLWTRVSGANERECDCPVGFRFSPELPPSCRHCNLGIPVRPWPTWARRRWAMTWKSCGGRRFRIEVVFLAALPTCGSCNAPERSGTIRSCADSDNGCACAGKHHPARDFSRHLCTKQYECCVLHFDSMDSQYELTCECWNPSQGGPTCESRLPPQPTPMWKRVSRCQ